MTGLAVLFAGKSFLPAAIDSLPDLLSWVYLVFLLTGGAAILTGLAGLHHFWSAGFLRSGHWFGATAFFSYALLLGLTGSPSAVLAVMLFSMLALGCAIRAHGIGIDTAANLAILQAVNARRKQERVESGES